jgi:hypothetical protein
MPYNALIVNPPLSIPSQPNPIIASVVFYPPPIGTTHTRPTSGQIWPRA